MNTKRLSLDDVKSVLGTQTSFGSALKSERHSREMSRKEFSLLLEISIQSLADLEHGRRIPSPERANRIAQQIEEPLAYWIQLAFQDQLREKDIDLTVLVS